MDPCCAAAKRACVSVLFLIVCSCVGIKEDANTNCLLYLDDVLICTDQAHGKHLGEVMFFFFYKRYNCLGTAYRH